MASWLWVPGLSYLRNRNLRHRNLSTVGRVPPGRVRHIASGRLGVAFDPGSSNQAGHQTLNLRIMVRIHVREQTSDRHPRSFRSTLKM